MLIFERLKQDYPKYEKDIDQLGRYMVRICKNPEKIFDDTKENFYWVNEAFKYGPGTPEYTMNMARYEMSLNFDRDFLDEYAKDIKDLDITDMSIDDIRKALLGEDYNEEKEKNYKEKIRIK